MIFPRLFFSPQKSKDKEFSLNPLKRPKQQTSVFCLSTVRHLFLFETVYLPIHWKNNKVLSEPQGLSSKSESPTGWVNNGSADGGKRYSLTPC